MKRQYTATTAIFENDKTLLIFHKKFQKWVSPGGHVDPNETPGDAARREAFEETGLHIEIISENNIQPSSWSSKIIERPFISVLHNIPPYGTEEAHQHIDFVFIARPIGGSPTLNTKEATNMKWFSLEELIELHPTEMFPETKDVLIFFLKSSLELQKT